MIQKILKVKSVGKFRDFSAVGDVSFRRMNLIYGENGRGKTTLCDIFRSLRSAEADYIQGRKCLGATDNPEVQIRIDDQTFTFSDGTWSAAYLDIAIYDLTFVHQNVYAGDFVTHEHKKSLYQVILGEKGVVLANHISQLDAAVRQANRDIKEKQTAVQALAPGGMSADAFLELVPPDDVDEQITKKRREHAAAENAEQIATKRVLASIALPRLPIYFTDVLERQLGDISSDAEKRVRSHVANRPGRGVEAWIAQGIEYVSEDTCPFCAQSVRDNALLQAYSGYFSQSYNALKQSLASIQKHVENLSSANTFSEIANLLERNEGIAEFWGKYVTCDLPAIDLENIRSAFAKLQQEAQVLAGKKAESPLDRVEPSENLRTQTANCDRVGQIATEYNRIVEQVNAGIEQLKTEAATADAAKVKRELADLKAKKTRQTDEAKAALQAYDVELKKKALLELDKEVKKLELDAYSEEILGRYQNRINAILERFNTGFRITDTRRSYTGGQASSTFQLVINGANIELGDSDTPISEPSFRNTLSAGDRSALAFAFFVAKLEQEPNIDQKTIVLDDPFSSQDRSRRTCTQQLIRSLGRHAKQILVLSHDPRFLRLVFENEPHAEVRTLQLCRVTDNTTITAWNIEDETRDEYASHHATLTKFINDGEGTAREVAKTIRLVLEGYLRYKFPNQFTVTQWLGDMLVAIRDAGTDDPLSAAQRALEELEDIKDFAKRYHHPSNPSADAEPVNEQEVEGYARRTIDLVGGF